MSQGPGAVGAKNSSARADFRDAGLMIDAQVGVIRCSFDGGCDPGLRIDRRSRLDGNKPVLVPG